MNLSYTDIQNHRRFEIDESIIDVDKDDFTIVIPVLNEEEAIGQVITNIKDRGYNRILVIDGYSTDETVSIASNNGVQIIYQHGIGKSGALKTAIENIKTPYFVVLDGDCTYDPADIKNFHPHLRENDQIIGVRTFGRSNIPLLNRFGNWVINTTFNFLFHTKMLDVCSGMYALKTEFAKMLNLDTTGFDVEVEIAAQTARDGRLSQVPINYYERVGKQKLRPFRHGIQIEMTIIKLVLKYNPVFIYSAIASVSLFPALFILLWVLWQNYNGFMYSGWAIIGIVMLIVGLFALTLGTYSMLLKRMEQRIMKTLKYDRY